MTEISSKGILRLTTAMFLFVGLFGIWMGGCQTQEQKEIKRLIKHFRIRMRMFVGLWQWH